MKLSRWITYRTTTLPLEHSTPNHKQGSVSPSYSCQPLRAPKGSLSILSLTLKRARPANTHTHTAKKKKKKEPQQAHEDTAKIKSQTAELEAKWGRRVNNRKNKGKKKLHVGQAHLLHWGTSMSSDSDRPSQRWASTASPHHDPSVHRCSSSSAFSWLDGRRTEVHRNKYIYIYINLSESATTLSFSKLYETYFEIKKWNGRPPSLR